VLKLIQMLIIIAVGWFGIWMQWPNGLVTVVLGIVIAYWLTVSIPSGIKGFQARRRAKYRSH